jgi:hypothetical protein
VVVVVVVLLLLLLLAVPASDLPACRRCVARTQGEASEFQVLMQQFTLLVFLTLEVAAALKLPTDRPMDNPASLRVPTAYTEAFASTAGVLTDRGDSPVRAQGVKLMVAFMGAVLGCPMSMSAFTTAVIEAYDAGMPARDLLESLQLDEFVQAGGLLPVPAAQV